MKTIKGPITFKKGGDLPQKFKDSLTEEDMPVRPKKELPLKKKTASKKKSTKRK